MDLPTFWRPGNLNLARRRASTATGWCWSLQRTDIITYWMDVCMNVCGKRGLVPFSGRTRESSANEMDRCVHGYGPLFSSSCSLCMYIHTYTETYMDTYLTNFYTSHTSKGFTESVTHTYGWMDGYGWEEEKRELRKRKRKERRRKVIKDYG